MKYLKKFSLISDYQSFKTGDSYITPNICYIEEIKDIKLESYIEPKPANNEIWYTNGSTTSETTPYASDVFGATIKSNTYDAEKGCWVITFNGDVTQIGEDAFFACSSLTSITIPDSVTSIGNYAFFNCSSLTSITIPDSVTLIGDVAFSGCRSLTTFYGKFASEDNRCLIIDGVLHSFAPSGLTSYTIPDSVTSIGDDTFRYCSGLTSVTIPNSVTKIGNHAFDNCSSLTSVTIGNSVTEIGEYAFSRCSSLTTITIPDSVTSIGDDAFYKCSSLTSVTIPNSVTSIGEYAFGNCSSLKEVYCKPTTPPTGGYMMFGSYASGRKIYVPTASVDAYKAAEYWSEYVFSIEGYDF